MLYIGSGFRRAGPDVLLPPGLSPESSEVDGVRFWAIESESRRKRLMVGVVYSDSTLLSLVASVCGLPSDRGLLDVSKARDDGAGDAECCRRYFVVLCQYRVAHSSSIMSIVLRHHS